MWGNTVGTIVHQRNTCIDLLEDLAPPRYHADHIHNKLNPQWKPELTFHFNKAPDFFSEITLRSISYSPIQLIRFDGVVISCNGNEMNDGQSVAFNIAFRVINPHKGREVDCIVEDFYSSVKCWPYPVVSRIRFCEGKPVLTATKYGKWRVRCREFPSYIPHTLVRKELPSCWGMRRREQPNLTLEVIGSKRTYILVAAREWLMYLYEVIRATFVLPTVLFNRIFDYCIEVNLDCFWVEFTGTREDIIKSLHNQSNFYEVIQVLYFLILRGYRFPFIYCMFLDYGPLYLQMLYKLN